MAPEATDADDSPDAELVDKVNVQDSQQTDTSKFVAEALMNVRGQLRSNKREAMDMTERFDEESDGVDDVLSPENVESIKVRARPFENPRVTVWLKDTRPIWANDAWTDTIYPRGLNAHNGKVKTTFDVRPF